MEQRIPARLKAAASSTEVCRRAPGRANLIGEHTDYNDGFVLPIALELSTYLAGRRVPDVVRLRSLDEPGEVEVDLASGRGPRHGWGRYVTAVVRALKDDGVELLGLDAVIASDVPAGSGLSSSAALEVVVAQALASEEIEEVRLARLCRRAENHYVGVQSGIMDQLSSVAARRGHALLIDCLDDGVEHIPIPENIVVVVIDSGVRRELADGGYNRRRDECLQAAEALGFDSLRRAHPSDLARLDGDLLKRARHVVTENERVQALATALEGSEPEAVAELLWLSHRSMATDFAISTPEIDVLVAIAERTSGVLGARLTGGGFGGCIVALVSPEDAEGAGRSILSRYADKTGRTGRAWASRPAAGAGPATA
ncbi:MAG: galactokinase [Actinomycetota bacterium]|nr:galactokinase [Actinomycetota bacterium]